ncbi:hypothetical protein GW750_01770 [bacterium]|nr:hypothetical protein [bacterium]
MYQLQLYADPYESKAKLALLRYDVFAVNQDSNITYSDVYEQQQLLYGYTL